MSRHTRIIAGKVKPQREPAPPPKYKVVDEHRERITVLEERRRQQWYKGRCSYMRSCL